MLIYIGIGYSTGILIGINIGINMGIGIYPSMPLVYVNIGSLVYDIIWIFTKFSPVWRPIKKVKLFFLFFVVAI